MARKAKSTKREKGYPPKVKKGALHKEAHIAQGKKIGKARLEKMKHSENPKMRKRANFALNFAYSKGKGKRKGFKKGSVSHARSDSRG